MTRKPEQYSERLRSERRLSPRTIEYAYPVLQSASRQAILWKMLGEVTLYRLIRGYLEVHDCNFALDRMLLG